MGPQSIGMVYASFRRIIWMVFRVLLNVHRRQEIDTLCHGAEALISHSLEALKSTNSERCNMERRGIIPTGVCNVRQSQSSH